MLTPQRHQKFWLFYCFLSFRDIIFLWLRTTALIWGEWWYAFPVARSEPWNRTISFVRVEHRLVSIGEGVYMGPIIFGIINIPLLHVLTQLYTVTKSMLGLRPFWPMWSLCVQNGPQKAGFLQISSSWYFSYDKSSRCVIVVVATTPCSMHIIETDLGNLGPLGNWMLWDLPPYLQVIGMGPLEHYNPNKEMDGAIGSQRRLERGSHRGSKSGFDGQVAKYNAPRKRSDPYI